MEERDLIFDLSEDQDLSKLQSNPVIVIIIFLISAWLLGVGDNVSGSRRNRLTDPWPTKETDW